MKKALLFCGLLATGLSLSAQQRLVLYEEFSGENCVPCAMLNPGLWDLLSANTADVILLKYQSPIPTPGPIYRQNTADVQARLSYYGVGSAPYGFIDAKDGSNIGNHTQAKLNAAKAVPANFDVTLTAPTVSPTGEIHSEISITSSAAYSGTNLKLRAALVESLHYDLPPGTNGEVEFHNVMRKMYPSADGQAIENSWSANQTETYTVSGQVPDYVNKRSDVLFLLVWIQEDGGSNAKSILQAAKSDQINVVVPVDVASGGITVAGDLFCSPVDAVATVTLKNTGVDPLTSAKVFYKVNNGSWEEHTWTGNLAADGTEDVVLPAIAVPAASGNLIIRDSVAMPNNQEDENWANNIGGNVFVAVNTEDVSTLPVSSNFENSPVDWVRFGAGNDQPMTLFSMQVGNNDYRGYDNSRFAVGYPNFAIAPGESGYLILPVAEIPGGTKAMDMHVAYAQQTAENDKLEVVYSEDCGETWVTVWEQSGDELKTAPPVGANGNVFIPEGNSDWRFRSVDVSNIPAGQALVAFRATSDGGSYLFLDNITFRTGEALSVDELAGEANLRVYPNPVYNELTLEVDMEQAVAARIHIVNVLGQEVESVPAAFQAGQNKILVSTQHLAAGVYFLNIQMEGAKTIQKKFVKK